MKKSITAQLFLVLVGLCFVAIVGVVITTSASLHSRFNEYTEEQDQQYAETVAATLVEFYRQFGGWELIRNNPWIWRDIIHMGEVEDSTQTNSKSDKLNFSNLGNFSSLPESNKRRSLSHWSLLDSNGKLIVGNPRLTPDSLRLKIRVDHQNVGTLVLSKNQRVSSLLEFKFLQRQAESSFWILCFATLLSLGAALWLARRFVAPIKTIAGATQQLTEGSYNLELDIKREDELGQLARDFNVLSKTLGTNEKLRRQFIADISHELRTPLSILSGELEAIQDGIRPANGDAINSLLQEVKALTHLVDDLYQLALSEIGQLKYNFNEVDLTSILAENLDRFRDKFERQGLQTSLNGVNQSIKIKGDEQRLNQLFHNLCENSVRYTDAGGTIWVNIEQTPDNMAIVTFEDSDPGVSEEEAKLLFDRFYRVEQSRNRATGGAGLGLALCHTIALAHQATIQATPSALGGLKLQIIFPCQANVKTVAAPKPMRSS